MPKIDCCLCSRRTDKANKRVRIGTASMWPSFEAHVENAGLDIARFPSDAFICLKCNATVSHLKMNDRGPNKKINVIKPLSFEATITSVALRRKNNNISNANLLPEIESCSIDLNIDDLPSIDLTEMYNLDEHDEQPTGFASIAEISASTSSQNTEILEDDTMPTTVLDLTSLTNESEDHINNSHKTSVILPNSNTIHLQGVKSSQSRCFICQCATGRKVIPWAAIQQAWFTTFTYIPKSNRTCEGHLTTSNKFGEEALQQIEGSKQDVWVNIKEFEVWFHNISHLPKTTLYNFEEDGVEAEKYNMFFGISKENFDDLVQYLHGMRNTAARSIRTALTMFLMLLRNNMKQEIIAFNFSTSQQVVSSTIDAVSAALYEHFVPKNLGYYHITREEALNKHSIKLTSKVLGQPENRLCLIADCTYNYIEKPADFELQQKTFSLHKKRNLVKPLYVVLPSGYILEAAGPYFCDSRNNDAANISHHYKNSDLLLFLDEDDFFIFDRGFRDVVTETNENGHNVIMPTLLSGKRTHFTCEEANNSRKATMSRWVVEAVNARVKNVFPFFKHTIEGSYVPKLMRFNRVACAIINKYFPPLFSDKDFHDVILQESENLTAKTNHLKEEIVQLGIQRMTVRWEKATEESVPNFPVLTMDDLKVLTLGTFQIKIAEKYIDHHLKSDNQFGIFIHREVEGIIRSKIRSRFSRSKTHDSWVKYNENDEGYKSIEGLYCSCKVGERTLGCCSHLTAVVRFLGYDRHQPSNPITRSYLPWDVIDCQTEADGDYSSDNELA